MASRAAKITYAVVGVGLTTLAGYLYWKYKKNQKASLPLTVTKLTVTTDNSPINAGTVHTDKQVHVQQPIPADSVLKTGVNSLIGKMLVAKFDGAGIYDSKLNKVDTTKMGQQLGSATNATELTQGSYSINYKDAQGNDRMINSVSVNVIV